jgi:hypothetical protein
LQVAHIDSIDALAGIKRMIQSKNGGHMSFLQQIAWVAAAISMVVGASTFVITMIDRARRERRDELLKWQRMVVYSLVQQGYTEFDDIKVQYITAAQQITGVDVPKKEIQDAALRLVLLSLLEGKLLSLTVDQRYVLNVVDLDEQKKQTADLAYQLFTNQVQERKAIARIFETVEAQPGAYSVDSLHRLLHERGFELDFDSFSLAVRSLVNRRELYQAPNNRLYIKPPASGSSQSSPTGAK